jgi:prepilin signal peptidase PulO-like enzyme (type II secretory pathway)
VLLRGKCGYCKEKISPVYPFVEIINGLMYFIIYNLSADLMSASLTALLFSALFAVFIIDYKYMIIPNELTVFILILAVVSVLLKRRDLADSFFGLLAGSGTLYLMAAVSQALLKKPGMGGGDIKLMSVCGLLLGVVNTFLALFLASVLTLMFLVLTGGLNKGNLKKEIPFGPALSMAVFMCYVFGEGVLNRYFSLIGINY